tara:strand:+ start:2204 stop:2533 length:330 start_codon:yes stop_codon:yes gene_type:complete
MSNNLIKDNIIIYGISFIFVVRVCIIIYNICKSNNDFNEKILMKKVIESDILNNQCSICLEENNIKKSFKLKCNHIFHRECIKKWYKQVNNNYEYTLEFTCPLCKTSLV